MTPRPLSQGHRRAALGKKENGKAPSVAGGAPEKIPVRNCQRTRNILGSPAQGGLKNAKLPHLSGRAIETAHDETPETKKSSAWRSCLRRRASIGLLQPNRMGCLYAISQLGKQVTLSRRGRSVSCHLLDLPRMDIHYIKCISKERRASMQVAKWGNSLAVRLPAIVVEALGLKEGDEIEIHVTDGRRFGVARKPGATRY
jgi:hypothetical protein